MIKQIINKLMKKITLEESERKTDFCRFDEFYGSNCYYVVKPMKGTDN